MSSMTVHETTMIPSLLSSFRCRHFFHLLTTSLARPSWNQPPLELIILRAIHLAKLDESITLLIKDHPSTIEVDNLCPSSPVPILILRDGSLSFGSHLSTKHSFLVYCKRVGHHVLACPFMTSFPTLVFCCLN